MTDDMLTEDWGLLFTVSATIEDLERIIVTQADVSVRHLAHQLDADDTLTAIERARVLARASPLIREKTREALTAGWLRLQAEAAGLVPEDAG